MHSSLCIKMMMTAQKKESEPQQNKCLDMQKKIVMKERLNVDATQLYCLFCTTWPSAACIFGEQTMT